jgi:glucose-6-phosphate 1-dehydrogenase
VNRLVIFGAGDVTRRYLLPAVAELLDAGDAPEGLTVDVVGRDDTTTDEFRAQLDESLDLDREVKERLLALVERRKADASEVDAVRDVIGDADAVVAYLALPPAVFPEAIAALAEAGLPEGSRVVVEKPFGTDRASAVELNDLLHRTLPEDGVFRVDHFLGMQTAHNILGLRFGNRVFEPLWTARDVDHVEIVWDETLTLEGRAGYYDGTGAARDMLQNHLLQLLCLVAMEPPVSLSSDALADRKAEVLRATRPWDTSAARCSVRARYTKGRIGDRDVPSYVDEDDVDPGLDTETYAEITFAVDTPRWEGVPFVLRSGKALDRDRHEVAVHFRAAPPVDFGDLQCPGNVLRFCIGPDRVVLSVALTRPDSVFRLDMADLSYDLAAPRLGAYATVLGEVLAGGNVLSVRDDEAVEAWRVIEPVLEAWARGDVPMSEYPAGSPGP